jgi:hypothetical protein
VRSRAAWITGAAVGAAGVAYRALRRAKSEPAADTRADELRRKLDESKPLVGERDEFESGERPVDEVDAVTVDEKRAATHERGRATADEMRAPDKRA